MQYVRLGRSGLKLSRIGLGMMSYGDPSSQAWALREDEAEPIVRQAAEAGIMFFDTADMYSNGASEQITGRLLEKLFPAATTTSWPPRSITRWGTARTTADCPTSTSSPASMPRSAASGPTTSIFTRFTVGTTRRRLRKQWPRCTT
jgi:Aldo/keto reductase family